MQLEFKSRVLKYLPTKPYCSSDKTASLIRTQAYALKETYIQLNPPHLCAWLIFDVDEPFNGEYAWEKHNLPVPNYFALSEESTYHLAYAIKPVFTTVNARRKPLAYLAAIERTYEKLLGSDDGFARLVTKNPLHPFWRVTVLHNHEYDLAELHDGCRELEKKESAKEVNLENFTGFGRNVALFDVLRYYAYSIVHNYESYNPYHSQLEYKVEELNRKFPNDHGLGFNEIMGIAKSVAKWTWRNRDSIRFKERIMQLDKSQPLETRQALGAHYAATVKADATRAKIQSAVDELRSQEVKATQKAVQGRTELSLRTIKTYWKEIQK